MGVGYEGFVCLFFPFSSISTGFVLFEIHHPGRNYSLLGKHPSFKKVIRALFLQRNHFQLQKSAPLEKGNNCFIVKDKYIITVSNLVKDRKVSSRQILKCN